MTEGTAPSSPDTGFPSPTAGGTTATAATAATATPLGVQEVWDVHPVRRSGSTFTSALARGVAAAVAYAGLAILLYRQVLFAPSSSLPGCNCGDQAQEVWFLRWPLYALGHGLNPFLSTWMNYPKGVNLAINTSSPLLGLVSAPLQLTVGAVSTYDVLLVVAVATSALAMCLALRRWVRSWAAAFGGGLLYGFSPYMFGQAGGHLFLAALFIPPIVLVLLDEIVVVQRRAAVRDGIFLGLLLALEYYISPEVLAMTVVMAVCGVALLAIARRHTVVDRAPHVAVAVACCVVICGAAIAYPVWLSTHGPQHVVGPPHPLAGLSGFPGDLLGPVLPTSNQLFAPLSLGAHGDALVGRNVNENGMYLGIPLVVVLAVFAWVYRRKKALVFFVAMLVVAGVLALGPTLVVDTRRTGVPLPARVLLHLPFLQDILDVRFSLFMQMAAAAALAAGLDEMVRVARTGWDGIRHHPAATRRPPRSWALRGSLGRLLPFAAPALVAVVALAPLVPSGPYLAAPASTPRFFTSRALDRIPAGSAVLTYPYPLVADAEWDLTFQAVAGMRFKVFGADAFVPDGPGGSSVSTPTPLAPSVVEHLFSDAYTPTFAEAQLGTAPGTSAPPVDRATVGALRTFLERYHVSTVVIGHFGLSPQTVVRYVSDALGPPEKTAGVWVWFDVPRLLARHGAG